MSQILVEPRVSQTEQVRTGQRWAVVLAAGEGTRMKPMIERWLGYPVPKQYCTFVGKRSMFQHTLDRASSLVNTECILSVIGATHDAFVDPPTLGLPGTFLRQPKDRGTAVGIFLAAAHALVEDPLGTLLIFPSDHFVYPEDRFLEHVWRAGLLAECLEDQLVLLGARASRAETDYGWIEPGAPRKGWAWSSRQVARDVLSFWEKPSLEQAEHFFSLGYLWNTMIVTAKTQVLWNLGWDLLPDMMRPFDSYLRLLREIRNEGLDPSEASAGLQHLYQLVGEYSFSRDFLEAGARHCVVLPMDSVEWCDWGRPDRVVKTIRRIGKVPSFPEELAAERYT